MTQTAESPTLELPDLTDPQTFAADVPHAAFAAMRELPGLYWQPTTLSTTNGGFWAVTRHADIVEIERDPHTFSSTRGAAYPMMTSGPAQGPSADSLMLNDPPRHTRLRRAAATGFTPKVVANFDPWIRDIVRANIAQVADRDRFDWVQAFARTIPAEVIATVVGVPREDHPNVVRWAIELFAATQQTEGLAAGEGTLDRLIKVMNEIADYCRVLLEIKRREPAADMCTALGRCVDRGDISEAEFLQWLNLMLVAGFETTHTAIGQSMRMYLEDDEVREATDRALDEGLIGRAVDEYLRFISPPMQMARTAMCDAEVAGQQVRQWDVLVLYFIAANRDPAAFSEPEKFDPWRPERNMLAFGTGIHRCMGAHLAKLELQILWEELRAAGLQVRLDGEPRRGWSNFINQLTELPVARV